jgi:crotonobetainyl-CoA:carnitine CoA-transferase CaiB-like acyl-CoA transferase
MDRLGLDWETLRKANRRLSMVRMPGYGLAGSWRDNPAFAQTIEQSSGMAWITGFLDDQPRTMVGPCDLGAGVHAAFAALVALIERDRNGRGSMVEVPMLEAGMAMTAAQVATFSAYGHLLERQGNRSEHACPQGVYRCQGADSWIAISVETNAQWSTLVELMQAEDLLEDLSLSTSQGRRSAQEAIDQRISSWCSEMNNMDLARKLCAAGISAGELVDPCLIQEHPHFASNGFIEPLEHTELGIQPVPSLPFRFASVERWYRHRSPLLGEDNEAVICGMLGHSQCEFEALAESKAIGWAPDGYEYHRPDRQRDF